MEYLLWMLGFVPKFIWYFLAIISVVVLTLSKLLNKIPGFYLYNNIIKLLSVFVLIFSVWFIGYDYNETKWQKEIEATKQKIETLESKNKELTTSLETALQNKDVTVIEKTKEVVKYLEKKVFVDKEVTKYLESCSKIPELVIEAHNKAATQK